MTDQSQTISALSLELVKAVGDKLEALKDGCLNPFDNISPLRNKLFCANFIQMGSMVMTETSVSAIPNSSGPPSFKIITLSDMQPDGCTYLNPVYAGYSFGVFFNNGPKFLDSIEGFEILPQGGFKFDPNKFTLLSTEQLRIII